MLSIELPLLCPCYVYHPSSVSVCDDVEADWGNVYLKKSSIHFFFHTNCFFLFFEPVTPKKLLHHLLLQELLFRKNACQLKFVKWPYNTLAWF